MSPLDIFRAAIRRYRDRPPLTREQHSRRAIWFMAIGIGLLAASDLARITLLHHPRPQRPPLSQPHQPRPAATTGGTGS